MNEARTPSLIDRVRAFASKPLPRNIGWWHTLGGLLLAYIVLQCVTGTLLALYYNPSPEHAYASLQFVRTELLFGQLVFALHHHGADLVVGVMGLHFARCLFTAAYKGPRGWLWASGVLLCVVLVLFPVTGILLPFDQKGFWATTVVLGMVRDLPFIGTTFEDVLTGGDGLGVVALGRFFLLHVSILPLALLAVAGFHLRELQRVGSAGPLDGADEGAGDPARPFFPAQAARDVVVCILGLAVLLVLAQTSTLVDSGAADPASNTFVPYPEWYFLPVYGLLRMLPAGWHMVGTLYLPLGLFAVALLLPLLDRSPERRPRKRKLANALAIVVIGGALALGGRGALDVAAERAARAGVLPADAPELTSLVDRGRNLFLDMQCVSCHLVEGEGEAYGPDLTHVAHRVRDDYIEPFLRDPGAHYPDAEMEPFDGTEEELRAILAYLRTLQ